MKRVLPLLAAALLGFTAVSFDAGCSSNSAYPFYDTDDDRCSSRSSVKTGTGRKTVDCESDDDDEDDAGKERSIARDSAVVTLATDQDVACMTVDVDAAYWIRRDGSIAALPTTDVPSTGRPTIAETSIRADIGAGSCALVRDGSYLWVTAFKEGVVRRLSIVKNADRTVSFGEGALTFGGFGTPSSIAVDAASVYVAEYDSGTIRRFAKPPGDPIADAGADAAPVVDAGTDAGAAPEAVAALGTKANHLVADDEALYWLSHTSADGLSGVRRVAKTGGAVTTLALAGKELRRTDLERIGGSLYFLDEASRVMTVSTSGGLATPVKDTLAAAFASEGTSLFVATDSQIVEVGPERNGTFFQYVSSSFGATDPVALVLLAQPGRLVWAYGGEIATRVIRR